VALVDPVLALQEDLDAIEQQAVQKSTADGRSATARPAWCCSHSIGGGVVSVVARSYDVTGSA
jgi:hypothetical protein